MSLAPLVGWSGQSPPSGSSPPFGLSPTAWVLVERAARAGLTLVVALVVLRLVPVLERAVIRLAGRYDAQRKGVSTTLIEHQRRVETLTRVTGSTARAFIWGTTVVVLLATMGLDIQPLIAGAGVAGLALGFGAQSIVKDFFAGFFLLLESQFDVGDTVTIAGVTGIVERMTMRITVIRDPAGTTHHIPNSSIGTVANKSDSAGRTLVDVLFAPNVAEETVRAALAVVADRADAALVAVALRLGPVVVEGPLEFAAKGVTWRLSTRTLPERAVEVRSAIVSALAAELRARGFEPMAEAMGLAGPAK